MVNAFEKYDKIDRRNSLLNPSSIYGSCDRFMDNFERAPMNGRIMKGRINVSWLQNEIILRKKTCFKKIFLK
jgi:hypothetical protein